MSHELLDCGPVQIIMWNLGNRKSFLLGRCRHADRVNEDATLPTASAEPGFV